MCWALQWYRRKLISYNINVLGKMNHSSFWRTLHPNGCINLMLIGFSTICNRPPILWQGSVQFCRSVVSDSLRLHGLQHTRPPCPSPTPGVYPNSCPLSRWCHPTISSSVVPFSSCLQSFPASRPFPVCYFFASGGQRIGVSASASVLSMNSRTDLLVDGLVGPPCSPRDSQESSPTPQFRSSHSSDQSM